MFIQKTFQRYVLIALISVSQLAHADETFTLKDSISYAIEHNRMLSASSNQVVAAQAQADMATARLMPRIDASTGFYRTDSALNSFGTKLLQQNVTQADFDPALLNNPAEIDNYQTRLGLSMPIFSGGGAWAGRNAAKSHAEASELNHAFQKQQLIFQTISAFVQARQSLAQLEAQELAVKAAEKRWQDAIALKKRGMTIESDVMDANVHKLRSNVALSQAKSMHEQSLESLRLILGLPANHTFQTLAEPNIHFAESTLDDLLHELTVRRTDFMALESEAEAADSEHTQAIAGFLPSINLVAAKEWNSDTMDLKNSNTMVGVTMNLNFFSGGADMARTRAAESKKVILSLQLQDKEQQIANEVRQAWRSLNTADQRLQSETEALKQTSESLRIKSLRHKQGLEKTSDLLDAQVRADASKVAHIRASYDFIIAKAALLLAAGKLNEEVVR